jgi:hypothetical protein
LTFSEERARHQESTLSSRPQEEGSVKLRITALLLGLAPLAAFGVAKASGDTFYGYTAPGTWFGPGDHYGSTYDNPCSRWTENSFSKGSGAWRLITFIDSGGGWHDSKRGYGWIHRPPSVVDWTKKLHCKNNTQSTYQGGCFGYRNQYQCA